MGTVVVGGGLVVIGTLAEPGASEKDGREVAGAGESDSRYMGGTFDNAIR